MRISDWSSDVCSSDLVFADGALTAKTKQIIAVAVAHVTQCPYCIKGHTAAALRHGASPQELMEAIWVAAEMRAGGSYAHSVRALAELETFSEPEEGEHHRTLPPSTGTFKGKHRS